MTAAGLPLASHAAPVLQAVALAAQRGERRLFRQLSFSLLPGQLVWLRGRNGCGKTSLLRLLAGLAEPAQGQVLLADQPVRRLPAAWRARLLYLAHVNALKDDLTVAESLRFLGRLQGSAPSDADLHNALAALGMAALQQAGVRTLSQGQRRRVALARLALPQPPSVWLLDEPFDALDDLGLLALQALLATQLQRGGSVLMTSHQAPGQLQPELLDLDRFAVAATMAGAAPTGAPTAVAA